MKGCSVTEEKRLSISPRVKIKVTAMRNPSEALMATDHKMALGSVSEASRISSAVVFLSNQYRIKVEEGVEEEEITYTCEPSSRTQ